MSESSAPRLADTLSRFADRLFVTGGDDPGDDALAVAPERLAVYRDLVRRNYLSMLRFAYRNSLRLTGATLRDAASADGPADGPADGLPATVQDIVLRFLEVRPASGHSARHIADVFRPFFETEYPALFERRPDVRDLMTLDRAELEAACHWDDPGRAPSKEELEELASAPVETFLATQLVRAPSSAALHFEYAAVSLHHRIGHREIPDLGEFAGPEHAIVSRHPSDLRARLTGAEYPVVEVLAVAPAGVAVTAEDLAGRWLAALPSPWADEDDTWKLRTFATAVVTGLGVGAFRLA